MSVIVEIAKIASAAVVAVSAALTARYAYKGLSIWREQHSGKIESDLATRLLASIYKYRDAVNDYTFPFIDPDQVPPVFAPNLSEIYQSLQAREKFHKENCDKMDSARQEIYVDILKGEALWDNEMPIIFHKMNVEVSQIQLKVATQIYEAFKKIQGAELTTKQEVEQFFDKMKLDKAVAKKFNEKVFDAEYYLKSKTLTQNPNPPPQPTTKKGAK